MLSSNAATDTDVLVVGAGPAGVVAAIELARRGVGVRIIEMRDDPFTGSRGKGLQPRTLELFEDLGVIDEVLASGSAFPRWRSYRGTELVWEKSIYQLLGITDPQPQASTPYPQTWMIPQWRTEAILRAALSRLGIGVEYATRLTALAADTAGVTATVDAHGVSRQIRAAFLLGADGAASATRKFLGVTFDGETRDDERYIIADVRTDDLDRTFWHNWSHPAKPAERVSICPLPHTDTFQFVAPIAAGDDVPPLTLATVQRVFAERSGRTDVLFTDAPWITIHRTNVRLASRFRVGQAFLVGDAAHAPPAAGGQGLNMSVQDGYNLAWKLAAVLRGAPDQLLDSYEQERRAVAARLHGVLLTAADAEETPDIFQLRLAYRRSAISQERRKAPGVVQSGDRAPDAVVHAVGAPPCRLFELMVGTHLSCLAFGAAAADECRAVSDRWNATAEATIDLRVVDLSEQSTVGRDSVRAIYGVADDRAVLLIRPDGYVCFAADENVGDALNAYLREIMGC